MEQSAGLCCFLNLFLFSLLQCNEICDWQARDLFFFFLLLFYLDYKESGDDEERDAGHDRQC